MSSPATPVSKGALLRVLGVGFGVAVSLGNSIGAGIMRTPAAIAERLPSAFLIMLAWFVGAFYTLLGAWSLSEVAAMIPSAGGSYASPAAHLAITLALQWAGSLGWHYVPQTLQSLS